MKNRKVGQWLCRIFWFAQLGAECLAGFSAWKLNMLPNLYFSALVLVFAMLLGITGLILKPFGRKKPGLFRIIFGGLLAVAVIAGCLFGGSVADSVSDMVNEFLVLGDGGAGSGRNYSRLIWAFFVFQKWYNYYI